MIQPCRRHLLGTGLISLGRLKAPARVPGQHCSLQRTHSEPPMPHTPPRIAAATTHTHPPPPGHESWVLSMSAHPSGTAFAPPTPPLPTPPLPPRPLTDPSLFSPAGHESWVLSVSAHPSGTAFATGSSDSRIKLWDLQTRTCAQVCGWVGGLRW